MRSTNKALDVHKMLETNVVIFKDNLKAIVSNCIERIGASITEPHKLTALVHKLELQTPDIEVIAELDEEYLSDKFSRTLRMDARNSDAESGSNRSNMNRLASSLLARESLAGSGYLDEDVSAEPLKGREFQSKSLSSEKARDPLAMLRGRAEEFNRRDFAAHPYNFSGQVKNLANPLFMGLFPKPGADVVTLKRHRAESADSNLFDRSLPAVVEQKSELGLRTKPFVANEVLNASAHPAPLSVQRKSPSLDPFARPRDAFDRLNIKTLTHARRKPAAYRDLPRRQNKLPFDFLSNMRAKITRLEAHASYPAAPRSFDRDPDSHRPTKRTE